MLLLTNISRSVRGRSYIYMYNSKRRDTFTFALTGRLTNTDYNIQENVETVLS